MKKLIWYHPHLYFWMGGTKFVFEVIVRLKEHFEVTVICSAGDKKIINLFERAGVEVIITSYKSTNSLVYWTLLPIFLTYDFIKSIKHLKKADYLIGSIYPANLICALYSALFKKEYYFFCYEPFPFFHHKGFISEFSLPKRFFLKILSFLYSWTDKWATKRARKIFTLDKYKTKLIKEVYGRDAVIASVGIDFRLFRHYDENNISLKFKDKIIITHSTDYTSIKHTELAIKTISQLANKYRNILLIITSTQPDSPYKDKYLKLTEKLGLRKNVYFVGLVPNKLLPLYYSASLCYLSTALDDIIAEWPVKESLSCETPVIRSPIDKRDVKDGVSGFKVNPRDVNRVAEKIEFFIRNPSKAREMGQNGRRDMLKMYKWEEKVSIIMRNLN